MTDALPDDLVHRLGRAVAEALETRQQTGPLTVGDLYHDIVPYAAVRTRIGADLHAEYEQALLRLLAGHGGLLSVKSEVANEELRREAASPFPSGALLRKYAAYEVRADPAGATRSAPAPHREVNAPVRSAPAPDGVATAADGEGAELEEAEAQEAEVERARIEDAKVEVAGAERAEDHDRAVDDQPAGSACLGCGGELPVDRAVNFCPVCGASQRPRACSRCDAPLERGWRYCVRCGQSNAVG
ncbi:MAG TPA: zinc ribbon domain-containing protein [Longimicrobiales bacterium]|nr:zinc ribbon domain-containing protein [Longimicrobiales bacterium]